MAPCAEIPMLQVENKVHGCQTSKVLCTWEFAVGLHSNNLPETIQSQLSYFKRGCNIKLRHGDNKSSGHALLSLPYKVI